MNMKNLLVVVVCAILNIGIIGCSIYDPSNNPYNSENSETPTDSEGATMEQTCKLIVNGQDISEKTYVRMIHKRNETAIPITAIAKKLGAEVTWEETSATISFEGESYRFDLTDEFFGVEPPEGMAYEYLRQVIDEVLI